MHTTYLTDRAARISLERQDSMCLPENMTQPQSGDGDGDGYEQPEQLLRAAKQCARTQWVAGWGVGSYPS
jgi:hypothetical protein